MRNQSRASLIVCLLTLLISAGCAGPTVKRVDGEPGATTTPAATPVTMPTITYVVPTTPPAYVSQGGVVNDLSFATFDRGPREDRSILSVKREGQTLVVERKRANSADFGSAIVYKVAFASEKQASGYRVALTPESYTTYKQGLISFGVPSFTESDLTAFLHSPVLHYRIEVDSQYGTESTFANLKRLLTSRPFARGERDPVTGKIFTQQFVLPYRGKEVLLTADAFPYRNGSKIVMNLRLPSVQTSPNTVDYGVILDEVTRKLTEVVAS